MRNIWIFNLIVAVVSSLSMGLFSIRSARLGVRLLFINIDWHQLPHSTALYSTALYSTVTVQYCHSTSQRQPYRRSPILGACHSVSYRAFSLPALSSHINPSVVRSMTISPPPLLWYMLKTDFVIYCFDLGNTQRVIDYLISYDFFLSGLGLILWLWLYHLGFLFLICSIDIWIYINFSLQNISSTGTIKQIFYIFPNRSYSYSNLPIHHGVMGMSERRSERLQ